MIGVKGTAGWRGWGLSLCLLVLSGIFQSAHAQNADLVWSEIIKMETGPAVEPGMEAEAFQEGVRRHLERQVRLLRDFTERFPNDPRKMEGVIKLAAVLAAQARVLENPTLLAEAEAIWAAIEKNPKAKIDQRRAAAFSRITTGWLTIEPEAMERERDRFLEEVRVFGREHAGDKRYAALLTEISLLYPDRIDIQRAVLTEANVVARDPGLRARIADDLLRLGMVGRQFEARFPSLQDAESPWSPVGGRPALIVFWSPTAEPSVELLAELRELLGRHPEWEYQLLAVAVADDLAGARRAYERYGFTWPLAGEAAGWNAPGVRALGINALPTLWIVDREGVIRHVMAHRELQAALARFGATDVNDDSSESQSPPAD